jgi:ECF sigma factor
MCIEDILDEFFFDFQKKAGFPPEWCLLFHCDRAMIAENLISAATRKDNKVTGTIVQAKMEGLSTKEIANNLNYSTQTETRKLNLIRTIWQEEDKL